MNKYEMFMFVHDNIMPRCMLTGQGPSGKHVAPADLRPSDEEDEQATDATDATDATENI